MTWALAVCGLPAHLLQAQTAWDQCASLKGGWPGVRLTPPYQSGRPSPMLPFAAHRAADWAATAGRWATGVKPDLTSRVGAEPDEKGGAAIVTTGQAPPARPEAR